jgi:hypothetical protein
MCDSHFGVLDFGKYPRSGTIIIEHDLAIVQKILQKITNHILICVVHISEFRKYPRSGIVVIDDDHIIRDFRV